MRNFIICVLFLLSNNVFSQDVNVEKSLAGFDNYMTKVLADWNEPGAGVAVVYKGELVYAKGFGYRDYGKKLPVTENTLFQIASNTKLFTAVAAGMLVEENILKWDKPIKESVPELEFYNSFLNNNVTLRDMLGHKTGISRHDMIWFQSDFSRKELFEKIKYLEPSVPLRQDFLYNNLMYSAVGYSIELKTGKTWEQYITDKILTPLEMPNTIFSIAEMQKSSDYGVPYNEKRDTTLLYKIPLKEDGASVGPAGSMITNLDDLSHWVIAMMNEGKYKNKEVIPNAVIKETMKPGIAFRNAQLEEKGYRERLNSTYGMARGIEVYKGHVVTSHGGAMPGFHSQVMMLPYDEIGIITFSIGDQGSTLGNTVICYNLVDRLLGLEQTDWNDRLLTDYKEAKKLTREGRGLAGFDNIENTSPTHDIEDYLGAYSSAAYGDFKVESENDSLYFNFRRTTLPMTHYHYNRFDTPDDEDFGKWSINFTINPQGEIASAVVSMDEEQVVFSKKPNEILAKPEVLKQYIGKYDFAGFKVEVKMKDKKLMLFGPTDDVLVPYKKDIFKVEKFDDFQVEFVREKDKISALKYKTPGGVYECKKVE